MGGESYVVNAGEKNVIGDFYADGCQCVEQRDGRDVVCTQKRIGWRLATEKLLNGLAVIRLSEADGSGGPFEIFVQNGVTGSLKPHFDGWGRMSLCEQTDSFCTALGEMCRQTIPCLIVVDSNDVAIAVVGWRDDVTIQKDNWDVV